MYEAEGNLPRGSVWGLQKQCCLFIHRDGRCARRGSSAGYTVTSVVCTPARRLRVRKLHHRVESTDKPLDLSEPPFPYL